MRNVAPSLTFRPKTLRVGMPIMITSECCQAMESVTDAICEIDQECTNLLGGVEHGLVNVKLEFRDRAYEETNKKLTEERLIAWLVRKKLDTADRHIEWEVPYPENPRRKCDLVIRFRDGGRMWLELKMAWKAWLNCEGGPTHYNNCYLPYLQGKHHTHSFRHDFEKLGSAKLAEGDFRAVCLIGFDCG